jgi:LysM repeat protein
MSSGSALGEVKMGIKRYIPFVLLNIVISAAVILGILYLWDQSQTEQEEMATATSVAATAPVATAAAVATASAPPTPEPSQAPVRHIVQAGDTLGTIAEAYDVPLDDIVTVNNIVNPNWLDVGTELIIPVGGIPTATPEPTPVPTSAEPPTPIPTEPPAMGEADVVIQEAVGVGDLEDEGLVIANEGSRQIQLANWLLEDSQGNVYTFSPFILFGDGANVVLHTTSGTDTTANLYWGLSFAVWESGETATLRDADGTARATYTIP